MQFTGGTGDDMRILITVFIYAVINFLLLRGILALFRIDRPILLQLIAMTVAEVYVLINLITFNKMIASFPVYCIILMLTSAIAVGLKKERIPAIISYVLIYISFAGTGYNLKNAVFLLIGALGMLFVSAAVIHNGNKEYVFVKIKYNKKIFNFKALLDTGNLLKDPITGKPVLVVGADIAQQMTGLSIKQLQTPLDSIEAISGLRLIPYKTIGQSGVFMLGLFIDNLRIGKWQGSGVIALSPEVLCKNGTYQALTGGYV